MNIRGSTTEILNVVPVNLLVGGGVATIGTDLAPTTTNITRPLIYNNSAVGGGGGIGNVGTGLNVLGAVTNVTNSTVAFNAAGSLVDAAVAGGILNAAGTFSLTNATVAHNRALLLGGGIVNVVGVSPKGTFTLRNTIVAKNTDLLGLDLLFPDTAGLFNSVGNNMIGNNGIPGLTVDLSANVTLFGGIPSGATVDIVGSIQVGFLEVDPLLGALQNNGGCTDDGAAAKQSSCRPSQQLYQLRHMSNL